MLNMGANQMSSSLIRRQLASALDLLVQVERDGRGMRRITAVSEITADETGRDVIALPFFSFKHAADGAGGQYYRASPREPGFVEKLKVPVSTIRRARCSDYDQRVCRAYLYRSFSAGGPRLCGVLYPGKEAGQLKHVLQRCRD